MLDIKGIWHFFKLNKFGKKIYFNIFRYTFADELRFKRLDLVFSKS